MNLKTIRTALGKTEQQMDDYFGFDSGTIYALENGNMKLELDHLDAMEAKSNGLFSFDWLRKEAFKLPKPPVKRPAKKSDDTQQTAVTTNQYSTAQ